MVDYESFEDVLADLNIDESDLKRLVSEGSLRAYRDEDDMKFRKDDIHALKLSGGRLESLSTDEGGDSISLDDADSLEVVEETDETLLDVGGLSDDVDFEDTGATSVPTVELDLGEEADATLTDELVFDDLEDDGGLDAFGDADATVALDDGLTLGDEDDLGLETEPLGDFADATMVEGGDDLTLTADDEITLGGDDLGGDPLDLEGGPAAQSGHASYATMAPPPMAAPQVQVQEKIKYVEILPSEPWWTKIVGGFFFVFMILGILHVAGVRSSDDVMGLASSFGFTVFQSGPMKENGQTGELKLRPMEGDAPMQPSSPSYLRPEHWLVTTSPTDVEGVFAPGMQVIRKFKGEYGSKENDENFNNSETRVSRHDMDAEYQADKDALDKLRRGKLLPDTKSPAAGN